MCRSDSRVPVCGFKYGESCSAIESACIVVRPTPGESKFCHEQRGELSNRHSGRSGCVDAYWRQHVEKVMATLSALFDPSLENSLTPNERRLAASWKLLAKIYAYEKVCITGFLGVSSFLRVCQKSSCAPNFRATRIYADTLLCVHNDIIKSGSVGEGYLTRPCMKLNEYVMRTTLSTAILPSFSVGSTGHLRTHMSFCLIHARSHRFLHRSQLWTSTTSGTSYFQSCS